MLIIIYNSNNDQKIRNRFKYELLCGKTLLEAQLIAQKDN